MDGAVSDNLPRCQQKNTITISAYAGESDLCPQGSVLNFNRVRFNNVSIQVNSDNMYRVRSTFFPPEPQVSYAPPLCASRRHQVSAEAPPPIDADAPTEPRREESISACPHQTSPDLTGVGRNLPKRLRGRSALPAGEP